MKKFLWQIASIVIFFYLGMNICSGETIFKIDFAKGDFADFGLRVEGKNVFDIHDYKAKQNNPGLVCRVKANQPEEGKLIKSFEKIKEPKVLKLSFDYGWGWGSADHGPDSVQFMLLNENKNGYIFSIGRTKANWALQFAAVKGGVISKDGKWIGRDNDFSHPSVLDGGGLANVVIIREKGGKWTIKSKDWNNGKGGETEFSDNTFSSFSQLVIIGQKNYDEPVFNNITLEVEK